MLPKEKEESVERCLYYNDIKAEIRKNNIPQISFSPEYVSFVVNFIQEKCNITLPQMSEKEKRSLVRKLVKEAYKKKWDNHNEGVHTITPISAIYLTLYEKYGDATPNIVYDLLEDLMVEALYGENPEVKYLYFPITPEVMDKQVELVKLLASRNPDICNSLLFDLFCAVSYRISDSKLKRCRKLILKACEGDAR